METKDQEYEKNRGNSRLFAGAVYAGGVVAVTAIFISFVLTAFPPNAYVSRIIMIAAGLMVGGSMLCFPFALHNWAVEATHRLIATCLYYGEMLFIAVNTVVSFVTLLARVTGYNAPEWAILYEPFSVLSIIYVICAWGTIFLTDPSSKTKQEERQYEIKRNRMISKTKLEYLEAPEGRADIALAAQAEILAAEASRQPKSFFDAGAKPIMEPWRCEICGNHNVAALRSCIACSSPRGATLPVTAPKQAVVNQPVLNDHPTNPPQ